MLTQARLKEVLHYDPETGIWRWLVSTSNRVQVGNQAGTIADRLAQSNSLSSIKGVSFDLRRGKWYGRVQRRWLGYYPTAEEAYAACLTVAQQIFGEFA